MFFKLRFCALSLGFLGHFAFSGGMIEFIGPCQTKPLYSQSFENSFSNVGDLSVSVLENAKIPFVGNREGFNSIFNTVIGLVAIETLGENEMKAYGWCFSVDGVSPESFAHQVPLNESIRLVRWFFAYAHLKDGKWIRQCAPAAPEEPAFLCQNQ